MQIQDPGASGKPAWKKIKAHSWDTNGQQKIKEEL